jgi:hypothetical protein
VGLEEQPFDCCVSDDILVTTGISDRRCMDGWKDGRLACWLDGLGEDGMDLRLNGWTKVGIY